MEATVKDLREYLRLPPDCSEDLEMYLEAAKSRARTAGIPDYKHNARYKLLILIWACEAYENRGTGYSGTYQATAQETAKHISDALVLELRYAGEDFLPATPITPLPINPDAPQRPIEPPPEVTE